MPRSKPFGFLVDDEACFAMRVGPGRVGLSLMQGDLIANISVDADIARAMAAALVSAADQSERREVGVFRRT